MLIWWVYLRDGVYTTLGVFVVVFGDTHAFIGVWVPRVPRVPLQRGIDCVGLTQVRMFIVWKPLVAAAFSPIFSP